MFFSFINCIIIINKCYGLIIYEIKEKYLNFVVLKINK